MPDLAQNALGYPSNYPADMAPNAESRPSNAAATSPAVKRKAEGGVAGGRPTKQRQARAEDTHWSRTSGMSPNLEAPSHSGSAYGTTAYSPGFGLAGDGMPSSNVNAYNFASHFQAPQAAQANDPIASASPAGRRGSRDSNGSNKPVPGTKEHDEAKKNSHKEVERRRREVINEGINELAKIVPNCDKNKGQILQRSVSFIRELKAEREEARKANSLEKVVLEQAVTELQSYNEGIQNRIKAAEEESARLKQENGGLLTHVMKLKLAIGLGNGEPERPSRQIGQDSVIHDPEFLHVADPAVSEDDLPEVPEGEEDA